MTTTTTWMAGDRVYVVADPELTGTVVDTLGASRVQVQWDGRMFSDWRNAADLEWYTLPASDVEGPQTFVVVEGGARMLVSAGVR